MNEFCSQVEKGVFSIYNILCVVIPLLEVAVDVRVVYMAVEESLFDITYGQKASGTDTQQ